MAHLRSGAPRERAEACVAKAFEVGVDFVETANVQDVGAVGVELDAGTLEQIDAILDGSVSYAAPDA